MADMNGDGYLNSEEFAMFSNPWRYARMYASDIRRNIKMFDADKDGRLNFEVSCSAAVLFEAGVDVNVIEIGVFMTTTIRFYSYIHCIRARRFAILVRYSTIWETIAFGYR